MKTSIPQYTHLVLSGGGMCGIVYIGIYRLFKQYDVLKSIHYITGTSIGSLFGFLFGMDIEYTYLETLFTDILCIDSPIVEFDPNNIFKLCSKNGVFSTERFRKNIVMCIQHKFGIDDITFSEYIRRTGVDLHVHTTCLNTYSFKDLCNDTYPDMSVVTAILASMSVPFLFEPVIYNGLVLVDGGCCANMQIYDILESPYNKVLQIYLSTDKTFTEDALRNDFMVYSSAVMLTMITAHSRRLIQDNKNKADILVICNNPLSFMKANFKNNLFYTTIDKSEFEESLLFGYVQVDNFFKSKGYFSKIS